jgi:uncharacterized membrane protein YphA (DoxX/SURF4 family)
MMEPAKSTDWSRRRLIAYWVTTAIIAAEFAIGGVMDVLRLPPFFEILRHLGYPGYFSVILGVWKVLGAVAVLARRFPRLKEWAYAGMFFNMTGAAASHLAVGDPPCHAGGPDHLHRPRGRLLGPASVGSPRRLRRLRRLLPKPHHRLLGHHWSPRPRVWSGRSDGRIATATILRDHEAPRLPDFLHDYNRRLVYPRRVSHFGPTLSQAQRMGLRRASLYLLGSGRFPLAVADRAVTLVAPIVFTGLVAASWALRPSARRVLLSWCEGDAHEIRQTKIRI